MIGRRENRKMRDMVDRRQISVRSVLPAPLVVVSEALNPSLSWSLTAHLETAIYSLRHSGRNA